MRTIFVYLALLTSFLGFSQSNLPSFNSLNQFNYQIDSTFHNHLSCGWSKEVFDKCNAPTLKSTNIYPLSSQISCGKFKVFYADLLPGAPAVGFADPVHGIDRINTFCAVLTYIQSVFDFGNVSSNDPIKIEVDASFDPILNPAGLSINYAAIAGPTFNNSISGKIQGGNIFDYINEGNNYVSNNGFHGLMKVNFDGTYNEYGNYYPINWLNNHTQNISNCQIDLFSVLLHEVGHMLGFLSLANNNGQLAPQSLSGNNNFSVLDFLLHRSDDLTVNTLQKFIIGTPTVSYLNPIFSNVSISDSKFWVSGNPAPNNHPIFSGELAYITTFNQNSFLSHLDEQILSYTKRSRNSPGYAEDYVMGPFTKSGLERRVFCNAEIKVFLEMGYSLNATYSNVNLNNLPPYSIKIGTDPNYPLSYDTPPPQQSMYVEIVNADATINNNVGTSITFNLWEDSGIMDPEGQELTVADGTLTNIRGCGNGENNHIQLTISADKKSITFTPRANFIGRAQFAFKLFDGAKVGSWHLYTVDVLNGTNVNYPLGTNLLINGDLEEGTEVRRLGIESNKAYTSIEYGIKEGFLRGYHYSDANPYSPVSNAWIPYGGGDYIYNTYSNCNPYKFGSATNSFPGGPQNNPMTINDIGERYRKILNDYNYFGLGSPLQKCHKYKLKFDYFLKSGYFVGNNESIPITFGFTNSPSYPSHPNLENVLTENIDEFPLDSWVHKEITFNYCSDIPTNFLNILCDYWVIADNIEIIEIVDFPQISANLSGINNICIGGTSNITANVNDEFCNVTYLWSNGETTSSINVSPISTQTYTVTVYDECQTATASSTITVNSDITPTFTQLPNYCVGQTPANLPTTSNNNIIGEWNPQVISTSTSGTTTYTFTPTAGQCANPTTMNVTVNPVPTATISGTNTICSGQSTTLTASGGGTYAWSTGATTASITVSPTTTTTYTATVTLNGCTSTVSRVVTVNPLPTATVSGTNTICSGQSTILTASGGGTYAWSSGATTASITVSPTTTTTYTATVTLNGCTSIASRVVTVNPLPTATISGTNTICSGQSTTLTASGGGTYAWSTGATTALITVNPTTTTTYTATVTLNGCTSIASRVVTVNPLPTATIAGTNTICSGQSTTLTALGGGSYAWSTGATTASITVSPTTTTTYTATVTLNGCTSTVSRVVTVNPLPTATISGTNTICSGQSTTLTASGGGSYAWSTGATTASITVSPTTTTTYTASVTLNGCTSIASRVVTVNSLPTATISGTNTICSGQSTTLTALGGGSYAWSTGATTALITVNPTTTTTYTATVTLNGCTSIASRVVTVNPLPTATIAGTNTICSGQSTTLTASGGGSYAWSTGATTASITVSPTTTTTYTATVTLNGCTSIASRVVTVNPLPTATISGTNTICSGQSTILTASGGGTYAWSTGATTASITVSPTTITTYTATVTLNGCTSTATRAVTVNPNPIFNLVGIQTVCSGSVLTISVVSPTNDLNNLSGYEWSPNIELDNIALNTTNNPIIINYSFSGTSSITGCTGTATLPVTINPTPPSFTISVTENSGLNPPNNGIICAGSSAILTASGTSAPTWSNGVTAQLITVSPTITTTYIATLTNAFGCSRAISKTITVNSPPTISITNPNPVICSGTSVTLTAASPTTGLMYTWTPTSGLSNPNISNPVATPSLTTTYTAIGTITATGCSNTASTTITVNSVNNTACCSAAGYTFNSPINSSAMGTIPSDAIIQVNANMTVNQNQTFTNCTLRMGPNVKIIVNSGVTLTLTNCKVFSCSEMWDGIYSNPGAMVIINSNSVIEDAMNAVKSIGGGSYQLTGSIFNKNNIAVYNDTYYNLPHSGTITGCTFDCSTTNTNTSGATLKAPMAGQKSHFGVYSYHANSTVGAINGVPNVFKNLEVGIFAFGQSIKIYKNNFSLIKQPNCYLSPSTCNTDVGWPIWCRRTNVTIGTSSGITGQNNFTDCTSGIRIQEGCPFQIFYNNFSTINSPGILGNPIVSKCIFVDQNYALGYNNAIRFNNFTTFEKGIYYTNSEASSLNISNNTFGNFTVLNDDTINGAAIQLSNNAQGTISISNNVVNNTTQTGTVGIIVQNPTIITGTSLVIQSNTIRNVRNGIWVTNYTSPQILNHEPSYTNANGNLAGILFPANFVATTPEQSGIHIENCPGATIQNNRIERTNYTTTAPAPLAINQYNLQFGISVGNNCTGTTVIDNSVRLLGTGIYAFGNTPITLKCNNMVNYATGLWVNSLIGNQGTVSAPQDNTWTIPSGYYGVRRNGQTQPQFFTRSFSLPYMPNTSSLQMNPPTAINPQSSSNSAPYTCFISAGNPPAGLVQVINEQGEYSYLSEGELKSLDVDLYKTLKINPDFYDETTEEGLKIQEFVDSVGMSNSAKIYEYEEKLEQKDTIGAKELMALFDAYSDVEYNYKRVYEIYNRSWLEKQIEFTAEDSLVLNEIAYLSPRVAGNAVYTARVLLGLMIIDTETYAAKSAQTNSAISYSKLKIYPNPSSEYFHYELPLKEGETGVVSILDVSGKILQTWSVDFNGHLGSFNVQNFAKGVYMFELTINNDQKLVQKLIVK